MTEAERKAIEDFMHFYWQVQPTDKTRKMVEDLIKQFERERK